MAQIPLRESQTRSLYEAWSSQKPFAVQEKDMLAGEKYVVKVDEIISGRFKKGLIEVGVDAKRVRSFVEEKKKAGHKHFIIEPCKEVKEEKYVSFETFPDYDLIRCSDKGGVNIEANWSSIQEIKVDLLADMESIVFPSEEVKQFYRFFKESSFAFLEINPYGYNEEGLQVLDFKARIDDCATAGFEEENTDRTEEEQYIHELDNTTSASLKFKLLNAEGRVWPLVAGGGASILYFDLINKTFGSEAVAFYGEYSGNPSMQLVHKYSSTIIRLMLKSKAKNKIFLIAGGNANFTYIPETFKGIMKAIDEYAKEFVAQDVVVVVRRAGPHDVEGLQMMTTFLEKHGIKKYVYGIDTAIGDTFNEYRAAHK